MAVQKYFKTIIHFLYLFTIFEKISTDQGCDKSKCKGPIRIYEDLGCTPTYGPDDNCCPIKYNCDKYKGRSKDKCFFKGQEYPIGAKLENGFPGPCNFGCECSKPYDDKAAMFICPGTDCALIADSEECYSKVSHRQCCPGPYVCIKDEPNLAKCEIDGKTYYDGQRFTLTSDPKKLCICSEGYNGENVESFCKDPAEVYPCNIEFHSVNKVYENCSPIFYSSQDLTAECNHGFRCQNSNDEVVIGQNQTETASGAAHSDPDFTCQFGNLTMKLGEELNQGTHYDSVCVRCVCELPPFPTCQRLSDDDCDVNAYAQFDDDPSLIHIMV